MAVDVGVTNEGALSTVKRAGVSQVSTGSPARTRMLRALLTCGIISSLLYVGTDMIAASIYRGYSYTAQQVSELSAIEAPTRPLWLVMSSLYAPLVIAFGIGVWLVAEGKRSLRVEGIMLVAFGVIGLAWALFAPMHLRGVGAGTATDTAHLVFAGVQVLLMVTFIAVGGVALGGGFRIFSIATIVAMLGCGVAVSALAAPAIAAGQPTPWMGLVERVSVYAPMVWIFAFALVLLRAVSDRPA